PAKFSLTGLTANPTLDLRFAIGEHGSFIPSCTSDVNAACVNNKPGFAVGNGLVWSLDRWDIEYIIAYAGTLKYATLESVVTKFLSDVVKVGKDGNPA